VSAARIVLCADDYGIAPGVGRAIRDLVGKGRVSAVSCMTASTWWPAEAAELAALADRVDVGIHLTLTDQAPLGPLPTLAPTGALPRFGRLLRLAYARRLARSELRAEMERQVDAFERALRRPPDFLDGHHHAQQLPVIRDLVADLAESRFDRRRIYVRTCAESPRTILRRGVAPLRALAFAWPGRALRRALDRRHIASNEGYSGAYDFSGRVAYADLFDRFLLGARDGTLINCHPGFVDEALVRADRLARQREVEYRFLASDDLPAALARKGVALGPFADRAGGRAKHG
jgi:predicted glycoside hydrolase/deacetylase ChbG (UPF0249 family)